MTEQSRIGITFGEPFEGPTSSSIDFKLTVSAQEAAKGAESLKELTEGKIESFNFSAVFAIEGGDNKKLDEIAKLLKLGNEAEEAIKDQSTFRTLQKALKKLSWETLVVKDKFIIKLSPNEELSEQVLQPFQMLLETGLAEIAQTQTNSVQGSLAFKKSAKDIIAKIKAGDRFVVPLLSQLKAELLLTLDQNLSTSVTEVLSQIDETLVSSPQMQFLKFFKNFDINLSFNSAEDLPEVIRQKILPGKKSQEDSESRAWEFKEQQSLLKDIFEAIGPKVTLTFLIDDFAVVNANLTAEGLSELILNYFGFALRYY